MSDILYTIYTVVISAIEPAYALDNFLITQETYLGDSACHHGYDPETCQDCDDEAWEEEYLLDDKKLQDLVDARRAEIECDWEIERSGGMHV